MAVRGRERREMRGMWRGEQKEWHINKKELWVGTVLVEREGVEKLGLREGRWRWWLDNQVVLAYVRRGGGGWRSWRGWQRRSGMGFGGGE